MRGAGENFPGRFKVFVFTRKFKDGEEGVTCTVGFNEWQFGEAVDVEMTQIPETSWFECTLPGGELSAEAFEIEYVFKTKG